MYKIILSSNLTFYVDNKMNLKNSATNKNEKSENKSHS